jgi:hypothetical protein
MLWIVRNAREMIGDFVLEGLDLKIEGIHRDDVVLVAGAWDV